MIITKQYVLSEYPEIVRLESRFHFIWEYYIPKYSNGLAEEDEELLVESVKARSQRDEFFSSNPEAEEIWLECHRINYNKYARAHRLARYIERMVNSDKGAVFLTLTFRDDVLKLKTQTRREYLKTWLRTHCEFYVANIDFGSLNGREHYHAVVYGLDDFGIQEWRDKYGFVDDKVVRSSDADVKRVSKYVAKLTNHALKETAKSSRILYPRNKELPPYKLATTPFLFDDDLSECPF